MKKVLLATACILAISATSAAAGKRDRGDRHAGTSYAYCLKTSVGPGDCKYTTRQQCLATLSGIGGDCVPNYGPR